MTEHINQRIEDLSGQMSLLEHLDEFRKRLITVSITILVTTLFSFIFAKQLVAILARPIGGVEHLQSIDVTENFSVFMKVSLMGGLILASPVIIYQLIAFIVPGLTKSERRTLYIAIPAASGLFLAGVLFAYFIMLPPAIKFLTGDQLLGIETLARPRTYFGFVTRLIFWLGLAFELPLVMAILARMGLVTPEFLRKNLRYALILIAIMAALITPTPDPINMGLAMAPLVILYVLGMYLSKLMYRPRPTYTDAEQEQE